MVRRRYRKKKLAKDRPVSLVPEIVRQVSSGRILADVVREMAAAHVINVKTLYAAFYAHRADDIGQLRHHGNCFLTEKEEEAAIAVLTMCSRCFCPVNNRTFLAAVREAFKTGPAWDGSKWLQRIRRSHADVIKLRTHKQIESDRVNERLEETVKKWCDYITTEKKGLWANTNVVNADETLICNVGGSLECVRLSGAKKGQRSVLQERHSRAEGCVIPFVCSDGRILMVAWVLRGKVVANSQTVLQVGTGVSTLQRFERRGGPLHFYASSESGYVTTELWSEILNLFCQVWEDNNLHGLKCNLLLDNLAVHRNVGVMLRCATRNVVTWFMPPHTSHFLQPLDNLPFAMLKRKIRSASQGDGDWRHLCNVKSSTFNVVATAADALKEVFTVETIRHAFKSTGIWPFSPAVVARNAEAFSCSPQNPALAPAEKLVKSYVDHVRASASRSPARGSTRVPRGAVCSSLEIGEVQAELHELTKKKRAPRGAKNAKEVADLGKRAADRAEEEVMDEVEEDAQEFQAARRKRWRRAGNEPEESGSTNGSLWQGLKWMLGFGGR